MSTTKSNEVKQDEKNVSVDGQACCSQSDCQTIREAAYYKWEAAGCPSGDGVKFWLEAEAEQMNNPRPNKPR